MVKAWVRRLAGCAAAAACVGAGGCYQKVVGAQGFGADQVKIEQGNLPESNSPKTLGYPTYRHKTMPGG
jgi:hypothetical protein